MPRYAALLRAINVGGHTVRMTDLRATFETLGFSDVSTYIASGNVLFTASARSGGPLEARIAPALEAAFGFAVATMVRTPSDVATAAARDPFGGVGDGAVLSVGFLARALSKSEAARVAEFTSPRDDLAVHGRELYWRRRGTINDSKFSLARFERALGVEATFRNITTVRALAELLSTPPRK